MVNVLYFVEQFNPIIAGCHNIEDRVWCEVFKIVSRQQTPGSLFKILLTKSSHFLHPQIFK